jgi:hypothetical protein
MYAQKDNENDLFKCQKKSVLQDVFSLFCKLLVFIKHLKFILKIIIPSANKVGERGYRNGTFRPSVTYLVDTQ